MFKCMFDILCVLDVLVVVVVNTLRMCSDISFMHAYVFNASSCDPYGRGSQAPMGSGSYRQIWPGHVPRPVAVEPESPGLSPTENC